MIVAASVSTARLPTTSGYVIWAWASIEASLFSNCPFPATEDMPVDGD